VACSVLLADFSEAVTPVLEHTFLL
jgi:hypothetical protein